MTSVLHRAVRPAALVLGAAALALGAAVPASAAPRAAGPTTAVSPATASPAALDRAAAVVAAKKPKRVKKPKLVKARKSSVRVSWPWVSGAKRYIVQASSKKKFTKKSTTKVKRSNPGARPSGGRVKKNVKGLEPGTTYRVRVRAVAPNGKKGKWSKVRKVKTLAPKSTTRVRLPDSIRSVTAKPGPKPGQVTFRWKHNNADTTYYLLELAATTFHPQGKNLPKKGRDHLRIKIPANKKKLVLSAKRAARAGSPVGSGNHLYYRFAAVSEKGKQQRTRLWPNLHAVQPAGPSKAAASSTTDARFGTFNLSSKKSDGKRDFDARIGLVARSIVSRDLGVVGLQELSPGTKGDRPTDALVRELRKAGGSYAMVRTSPYFAAGTKKVGSQGSRIVYDTDRYALVSSCSESTGNREYSSSCAIEMATGPGEKHGRMANYAQLRDKSSGAQFWFVSVHLTPDKGGDRSALRTRQIKHVVTEIEKMNSQNLPIVVAGDLNSWQNRPAGNAPHDFLVGHGFVDTFAAAKKTNPQYSTYNQWNTRVKKYGQGFGVRLDYVLVKNGVGVQRWRNIMKPVDSARASDHNLVVADVLLPVRR